MSDASAARRWLDQAMADLHTATDLVQGHPYAACFFAQQAAEKAIKAVQIASTGMLPRTHSVVRLLDLAQELQQLVERRRAADLDRLYTETRYPDALPDTIPAEYFTPEHAGEAIAHASRILQAASAALQFRPESAPSGG
jgi:HEPN domain-containing protein